jgi:hypothetical protein
MTISIQLIILILLWGFSFYPFAYAANLGRLFTTPEERAVLDAERSSQIPKTDARKDPTKSSPLEPPLYITFNGLMTRSQEPAIVWINGSNELVRPGFKIELDKMYGITVPIFLSKAQQRCFLKPGQTLNTRDKRVQENFELLKKENPEEVKQSCISIIKNNQGLP